MGHVGGLALAESGSEDTRPSRTSRYLWIGVLAAIVLLAGSYLTVRVADNPGSAGSTADESLVKQGDPNELAPPGAPLEIVMTPPNGTLTTLSEPGVFSGALFSTVFAPYGWTTDGDLVVRFESASVESGTSERVESLAVGMAGMNAVVRVTPQARDAVSLGGLYEGRAFVAEEGDAGVFGLDEVEMASQ